MDDNGFPAAAYDDWKTEAPSMPSGHGKPLKALLCRCADCDYTGSLLGSIVHYQTTAHRLVYRGYIQDFSHLKHV